jgi:hypothetical protein
VSLTVWAHWYWVNSLQSRFHCVSLTEFGVSLISSYRIDVHTMGHCQCHPVILVWPGPSWSGIAGLSSDCLD